MYFLMQINESPKRFDYGSLRPGFYHDVMAHSHPIRRAWHEQKFKRVIESISPHKGESILDVGCFAGTFLSLLPETLFSDQVGVDILPSQIEFATKNFAQPFRRFICVEKLDDLNFPDNYFDYVTLIEVIEHLEAFEIDILMKKICKFIKPGGKLILTTPNYTSCWPLVEYLLGKFSDITYEEQHITKFNYFNVLSKLAKLSPTLLKHFRPDFRTTTHFLAPFLAFLSMDFSRWVSNRINHRKWAFPFGNLILLSFTRINNLHKD
jgi:2-polyprenyl-3-methyl-5-hydroxy-6-metoxy-1,4-benzoquinol methylase